LPRLCFPAAQMAEKKKFVITPFRPNVQMNSEAAKGIWRALKDAIVEIHGKNASSLSFEELYRNAYNLVLHKHGELLYAGVTESVTEHLRANAARVSSKPDDQLLAELTAQWDDHKITMVMIRDILMYMDRTYVMQRKKKPVYDLGLQIFLEQIARHADVKDRLRELLLRNIHSERTGEVVDRSQLKNILSMLQELGVQSICVYEQDFEGGFIKATEDFYRHESQDFISQNTCPDYMRKAEARLQEEQQRVAHYLSSSTEQKLKRVVEHELIQRHASALVEMENSGCASMFNDGKVDDLKRMYRLFSRVPETLQLLCTALSKHIKARGSQLVRDQDEQRDPVVFVQELLNLRDKYGRFITESFRGAKNFEKVMKEAFEAFINADARVASYLAQYVDDMLRSKLRGLGEEQVEERLSKVIVIFRYLQDKDVFENFYKQHLAKRLISGRSVSDEAERNMISKLKVRARSPHARRHAACPTTALPPSLPPATLPRVDTSPLPPAPLPTDRVRLHVHVEAGGHVQGYDALKGDIGRLQAALPRS